MGNKCYGNPQQLSTIVTNPVLVSHDNKEERQTKSLTSYSSGKQAVHKTSTSSDTVEKKEVQDKKIVDGNNKNISDENYHVHQSTTSSAASEAADSDNQCEQNQNIDLGKLRIFLSYGHDEHRAIADRICMDLKESGHEVWFDTEMLQPGYDYENKIEEGIQWVWEAGSSARFLLLMTPHSVRKPNGYCLNELARALDCHLSVIPLMVVEVEPPLSICRIQWFDMKDCVPIGERIQQYQERIKQLIEVLKKNDGTGLDHEGVHSRLRSSLRPLSYQADFAHYLPNFVGRKWLFDLVLKWLEDKNASKVFWITGDPGSGKTAFASVLCTSWPQISAYHICRFADKQKSDPKFAILSIIWQLATQLPELYKWLNSIGNLEEICDSPDATVIFERLLVDPLNGGGIIPKNKTFVILIDGVDEATRDGSNYLAEFLAEGMDRLPLWIRFILTSRPDQEVTKALQGYKQVHIELQGEENKHDVKDFLYKELGKYEQDTSKLEKAVQHVASQSGHLFLYVEEIRKQLNEKEILIENTGDLPRGLGGIYHRFFRRRFPDLDNYDTENYAAFCVIGAAFEPITLKTLAKVLGWDKKHLYKATKKWGSFYPIINDCVIPYHKSLLDWLVSEDAGDYRLDCSYGHKLLATAGWVEYLNHPTEMSDYMRVHLPGHLEKANEIEKMKICVTDSDYLCSLDEIGMVFAWSIHWRKFNNKTLYDLCLQSWQKTLSKSSLNGLVAARSMGKLFLHSGHYSYALDFFQKQLKVAEDMGDSLSKAESLFNAGWCYRHMDKFDQAIEKIHEACNLFELAGDRPGLAKCLSTQGMCYWHKQDDEKALEFLQKSLEFFEETKNSHGQAEAWNHLGIVHRSLGQYENALVWLIKSKEMHLHLKNARDVAKCCNSIGTCLWWSGDLDGAISSYEEANKINSAVGNQYILGLTANNLGYIYLSAGHLDKAHHQFNIALKIRHQLGSESYEMMDLSGLALTLFYLGDVKTAKEFSTKAVTTLSKYDTVEDDRRAYYNHFLIMKDGNATEKISAKAALMKAKNLVKMRLDKVSDVTLRKSLQERVPLMKEIMTVEIL